MEKLGLRARFTCSEAVTAKAGRRRQRIEYKPVQAESPVRQRPSNLLAGQAKMLVFLKKNLAFVLR
ncbi:MULTISPECIES: hypothetical protein [unclassified Janthinobacterium]|uniref:hypothetical protein n=1 Tax=unclassified Janthinobacterium TaxID=2610881 RepID=UPI0018CB62E4|nr:hypothetical protein [Janthinobacterium sp. CG_23.4]MCL6487234.1 hypothetical protein [Janthinobacterium lividum]MDH6160033.1 hypothetical protein [Janthinobacterium sp. CG_23.4]